MQFDDKERFQQLADAASHVNFRQAARTNSGWYFTLSAFFLLPATFLLPDAWVVGWLVCAIAAALAGVYGIIGNNLKSILLTRIGISIAIAIFSVYRMFRPGQQWGFLFGLSPSRNHVAS